MEGALAPDTKALYRLGGISAIVLGVSYIVITALYVLGGALPSGAEEWLKQLAGHATAWSMILGLSVLTDFVAAAHYPSAVLTSALFGVYAILVPSLGILMIGLVMRKGTFDKLTAYLGVCSGILGIVSVVGPVFMSALGATVIVASVLTTVWALSVGYRLYRLS